MRCCSSRCQEKEARLKTPPDNEQYGSGLSLGGDTKMRKTGFDYDEMYDASEAYIASMGGRGAFYG